MLQFSFNSGNYEIIKHGQTYVFDHANLKIELFSETGFKVTVVWEFIDDDSEDYSLKSTVTDNTITFYCSNFPKNGAGLCAPIRVATINNKNIYLIFWSFIDGQKDNYRARSVRYTFFSDI